MPPPVGSSTIEVVVDDKKFCDIFGPLSSPDKLLRGEADPWCNSEAGKSNATGVNARYSVVPLCWRRQWNKFFKTSRVKGNVVQHLAKSIKGMMDTLVECNLTTTAMR